MVLKSIFDEELMELLRFEVDVKNVMEEEEQPQHGMARCGLQYCAVLLPRNSNMRNPRVTKNYYQTENERNVPERAGEGR